MLVMTRALSLIATMGAWLMAGWPAQRAMTAQHGATAGGNQDFKLFASADIAGTNLLTDTTW